MRDTGFDYERDLDRVAIAVIKRAQETPFFAVADGRFDRKKIAAYASQNGTRETRGGREIFSVPVSSRPSTPRQRATPAKYLLHVSAQRSHRH